MSESTEKKIKNQLLELNEDQRIEKLAFFIRDKVCVFLNVAVDEVPVDAFFSKVMQSLNISDEQTTKVLDYIFDEIKDHFDIHYYFFEKNIETILELSTELSSQIEVIWSPAEPPPIKKISLERRNWPWDMADSVKVGKKIQGDVVFLLSCLRSGSTISRLILAAHPNIFSPPELHLLPFNSMMEREQQIRRNGFEWMSMGLIEALIELENISFPQAKERYEQMVKQDLPISRVYEMLLKSIGQRMLVDKTPFYACHIEWLKRAEQLFENPKYIFLTRHPYGMISSFVKLRLKTLTRDQFGPLDENPWRLAEKWWFESNKNIIEFMKTVPSDRQYHVKYEDIVANSETKIPDICEFLGMDFIENILNPYQNNSELMIRGIGDPNIAAHSEIDKTLADSWKKTPVPQVLSADTKELAAYLEYSLL